MLPNIINNSANIARNVVFSIFYIELFLYLLKKFGFCYIGVANMGSVARPNMAAVMRGRCNAGEWGCVKKVYIMFVLQAYLLDFIYICAFLI